MKNLLLVSMLFFCGAAYAQAPGPVPGPAQVAAPLTQEDAIGAEMGRTMVRVGIYRWENEQLRKQVADLTAQLAAAKADADALRSKPAEAK